MDIFNNAAGDPLFSALVHAGAWMAVGSAALLILLSLGGRQESRR